MVDLVASRKVVNKISANFTQNNINSMKIFSQLNWLKIAKHVTENQNFIKC